jgi:hypothetical protein
VARAFERSPEADIIVADTVVTDPDGQFICCRKSLRPWPIFAWTYNPTITSSIFYRRRVVEDFNLYFDVRWRDVADGAWMRQALQLRLKMTVLRRYTSVFTDTGENMNLKPNALREKKLVARMTPAWARWLRWPLLQAHRLRALSCGLYRENPFTYLPYTPASPDRRVEVSVSNPTGIWWKRHEPRAQSSLAHG